MELRILLLQIVDLLGQNCPHAFRVLILILLFRQLIPEFGALFLKLLDRPDFRINVSSDRVLVLIVLLLLQSHLILEIFNLFDLSFNFRERLR